MTHQIRRVATAMLVLFGVLFVNLNVIQLFRSERLANHPANERLLEREYAIQRGPMIVGETEIVHSRETDDDLKYLREYLDPQRYAHVTGFYSFVLGRSGLERAMNEELTGTSTSALAENLNQLLAGRDDEGNAIRLTIDEGAQRAAQTALGDRVGAVVALDPRTGAVLASYSNPSYDPNRLSSHDANAIFEAWEELQADPGLPLLDRVARATYAPGSTFKLIVSAAALEQGLQPSSALRNRESYTPPLTTRAIPNFSPGRCGDGGSTISLQDALRVSCNAVFAELGVQLGEEALNTTATRLGFGREIPYELPTVPSQLFVDEVDDAKVAQSAIGQRDVRWSPLHAALVVASIVNDGTMVAPHVVASVLDPASRVLRGPNEGLWRDGGDARALSERTAQQLREMMVSVVENGTGTRAAIPGRTVGGKTGTAEDPNDDTATAWFVGFSDDDVVVAVVVPDAGGDGGGTVAAPIAKAVMEAVLS